ncbi:MAG: helix-turn-helix domain-containing protein [Proteobacteria bacterium]|nr:helix-turn-helix domain-containing protein [Pseudomonadota bacterium]
MRTTLRANSVPLSITAQAAETVEDSPDYVQSLARGLAVIRAFDAEHPSLSQAQLAERTGLARAVVRRSLITLRHLGYVDTRGRDFFLTPRVLELGFGYLSASRLPELALPAMEGLVREVKESCSMSVLDGEHIVYVARVPVSRIMTVALGVGARLPAYAASMGRVLLAGLGDTALDTWLAKARLAPITAHTLHTRQALRIELLKVRRQGYALVSRELEPGLCAVAVPIRVRGEVVAGLNVSLQYRADAKALAMSTLLPALHEAQAQIERTLAQVGMPAGYARA